MPATITNPSCSLQQGGTWCNAACDVSVGQGETLIAPYVRIYPSANPSNYSESFLGDQGNGHYASSWASVPGGTQGPYSFTIRVDVTTVISTTTAPANVS